MNSDPLKTFTHLESAKRVPSDYEISSTDLHYYPRRGVEVETPIVQWYKTYQQGSPLKCSDWNLFSDPRATTYASYMALQNVKELYTAKLFDAPVQGNLSPAWRAETVRMSGALRFLFHGLQMIAAYVGQMAPSSKVTIICTFQAADEMRKVHNFAYCLALLEGQNARASAEAVWMADPAWQPMRRLIEELLVVFDWGEAFAALNLVVKPRVDGLLERLAKGVSHNGGHRVGQMIESLLEDSVWHRQWSDAFKAFLIHSNHENDRVFGEWIGKWSLKCDAAVESLMTELDGIGGAR